MTTWPDPNAPRHAVDAFLAEAQRESEPKVTGPWRCDACGHEHSGSSLAGICIGCPCPHIEPPAHEAPAVSNGPSPVCNGCSAVRVSLTEPFCRNCKAAMAEAGVR